MNAPRLLNRLMQPLQPLIDRRVRAALATVENDATFAVGSRAGASAYDRFAYDREEMHKPGAGSLAGESRSRGALWGSPRSTWSAAASASTAPHPATAAFLHAFWEHPLNRLPVRLYEWCDELTRSGNLFLLLTTDLAGMSYVRAVPSSQVKEIASRPNDLDQEIALPDAAGLERGFGCAWNGRRMTRAVNSATPAVTSKPVMLHYAINRPVGAQWGESDLAPILRWLSRYAAWLEDRARLNHFRTAFLYVVKARFTIEAERRSRQSALNAMPPSPGSILVDR